MNKTLPKANFNDFVTQKVGDELLIYNLNTHKAFSFNPSVALILSHCDGNSNFQKAIADFDKKFQQQIDENYIKLALDELSKMGLIKNDITFLNSSKTRREVIFKYGLMAVALPVITAIVVPTAAHAQSGETCNGSPVGLPDLNACPSSFTSTIVCNDLSHCPPANPGFTMNCWSCCCQES